LPPSQVEAVTGGRNHLIRASKEAGSFGVLRNLASQIEIAARASNPTVSNSSEKGKVGR
jgi:hypothetical protein